MRRPLFGIMALLFFLGCKPEVTKEAPIVRPMVSPAGNNSALPFLFSNENQTLLSWVEKIGDSLTELKYAKLVNDQWQTTGHIHQGSDWFVNWADYPAIAESNGNKISHVLKKSSASTYSYDIRLNLLSKGEKQWKTNLPLHTDGTPAEHGFVTTLPYKDGFFVTWLDGRNTIVDENGNRGAMTIRAAEVSPTGEIRKATELDDRVCDCCQTTAAITANGPVVMYRDRSEGEVRDMSIVRWANGKWTAPKTVHSDNWQIKGCPVNGPRSAVLENTLAMAWFTGANEKPMVKLVFSGDGGANFEDPITISESNAIGRVDVLLLNEHTAIVSWMEAKEGKAQLRAVKVGRDGTLGKPHIISEMNASRQSGFPQMEQAGDKVHFAWTAVGTVISKVKVAFVQTDRF